jgi:hypothetical protein
MPKFNPEKHYLGTLCKRGHDYEGTGKSIRYKRNRGCVKCDLLRNSDRETKKRKAKWHLENKHRRKLYFLVCEWCGEGFSCPSKNQRCCCPQHGNLIKSYEAEQRKVPIDHDMGEVKAYFGSLCDRGHDYNNTGHSLRDLQKGQCLECKRLSRGMAYGGSEGRREYHRKQYAEAVENSDKLCACGCGGKCHPDKDFIHGHYSRVSPPMLGRTGELSPSYICGGYVDDPVRYKQRHHQKSRHWKEAIAWAKDQPEPEKSMYLRIVEARIDEKLAVLDLKKKIKEIQNGKEERKTGGNSESVRKTT